MTDGSTKLRNELESLRNQLNVLNRPLTTGTVPNAAVSQKRKTKNSTSDQTTTRQSVDAECPYCDEIMIASVDKPFPASQQDLEGWE